MPGITVISCTRIFMFAAISLFGCHRAGPVSPQTEELEEDAALSAKQGLADFEPPEGILDLSPTARKKLMEELSPLRAQRKQARTSVEQRCETLRDVVIQGGSELQVAADDLIEVRREQEALASKVDEAFRAQLSQEEYAQYLLIKPGNASGRCPRALRALDD